LPISKDDAENNLDAFLQKHGREGFLKLFLTNYLQELVLLYLHSRPRKESDDTSSLFYVNFRGQSYTTSQIDEFKRRLRGECATRAQHIVDNVKDSGFLERLAEDPARNPQVPKELEVAFRSIIKEIA